jgi:hypothetical protein
MTSLGSERGQKRVIKSAHSHMTTANRKKIGQKKSFFFETLFWLGLETTLLTSSIQAHFVLLSGVRCVQSENPFSLSPSLSLSLFHTHSLSHSLSISHFKNFVFFQKTEMSVAFCFRSWHAHADTPTPARPCRHAHSENGRTNTVGRRLPKIRVLRPFRGNREPGS